MIKLGLDAAGIGWAEISGTEADDLPAATADGAGRAVTCPEPTRHLAWT